MWEKYDVRFDNGQPGFGGEYPAQSGFGWTNGVVLEFIRMFYTSTDRNEAEQCGDASTEADDADGYLALEAVASVLQTLAKEMFTTF